MKRIPTIALAAALLGGVAAAPSAAATPLPSLQSVAVPSADQRAAAMDGFKRHLAEQVARRLDEPRFRDALIHELAGDGEADLAALLASAPGTGELAEYARRANTEVLRLKGIQAQESLLQIRIDPAMAGRISAGSLVTATPSADEKKVRTLVAYDSKGRAWQLDAFKAPERPVLVVGLDERKDAELAQRAIRQALTAAGIGGTDRSAEEAQQSAAAGTRPVSTIFRITNVNDHEPWYKGGPEIYAWVAGAGTDGKARVDQLEMPYIQEEGKSYAPGQVLIEWSNFSWSSLDVVWMEHDDNADLSGLVRAVVDGALVVSGNGQYVQVADKIVSALPTGWVTDDDDWVDSCYNVNVAVSITGALLNCAADPDGMHVRLGYKTL
ncbi:DUF3103 family protein [Microbispora sp. H10830]|uniref:DUF3103 family protein n=1 Tax=Microbispora sp. H10830 TaxID=2729109 RepID=UPI001602D0D9|nr:DUF3103 family protein [Microbispora sp. H10830]